MRWKDSLSMTVSLGAIPLFVTSYCAYAWSLGFWSSLGIFTVAFALNVGWMLLWVSWYEQGKFFNMIRYPRALSLPTWLIVRLFRWLKPFPADHLLAKAISLADWNRYSTALTRRFDLAFLALGIWFWTLTYILVTKWQS